MVQTDEERKAKEKEYRDRPEIKEREKERRDRPENKAKAKERRDRPENKAKVKDSQQRPEYKARVKERQSTPEYKAKVKKIQINIRLKVLQHYSKSLSKSEIPCCRCCGERSHMDFLAIDHIAGKKQMDSEPELA